MAAATVRPDGKTGPIAAAVMRSTEADVSPGCQAPWPAGIHWYYSTRGYFNPRTMADHVGSMIADQDVKGRAP